MSHFVVFLALVVVVIVISVIVVVVVVAAAFAQTLKLCRRSYYTLLASNCCFTFLNFFSMFRSNGHQAQSHK